nr:importin beta-related nuclear transport receptor [Cryptomonas curvata]
MQKTNEMPLFDKINSSIDLLYNFKNQNENWESQKFLTEFQNQFDSYKHVPLILQSSNPKTIYFGLQIMEQTINYHWCRLAEEEKKFLQNFITDLIFKFISNADKSNLNLVLVRKMNLILVKIFIQSDESVFIFLKDLIQSAKISEYICENNLNIIFLLFDEIFSVPNARLSSLLRENDIIFFKILKEIELLCYFILMQKKFIFNNYESFISIAVNIFQKIIIIAPPYYMLEDYFLETFMLLCTKNNLKNIHMQCLIEMINSPNILSTLLISKAIKFFILQFQEIISISKDISLFYEKSEQELKEFIMNGAIFFLTFLKNWWLIVKDDLSLYGFFLFINQLMLKISCVPDLEIFKICLDWWSLLIQKIQSKDFLIYSNLSKFILFDDLKVIIISRMAKPEEVLLIEDENGSIIRETTCDTNSVALYNKEKEILIYLSKLNEESIKLAILEKLSFQFNKDTWNRSTLNSLCWSVGAISGIFTLESEKNFIVSVIKDLLCLAELKKGKDNKAVIASNIMYIVGQYPRFLQNHWKFLKTVIYKLFEFMNETHPGVQDMACDTFFKIGKSCANCILILQEGENRPFFDEILDSANKIINFLEYHNIEQFYQTLSIIINSLTEIRNSNYYISKLFEIVNNTWFNSLKKKLIEEDFIFLSKTADLLKLNKKIASILERKYYYCIKILYSEFRYFYDWSFEKIIKMTDKNDLDYFNFANLKDFVYFKNEILGLIENYIVMSYSSELTLNSHENFIQVVFPIINNDKFYLNFKLGDSEPIQFCIITLTECKAHIENNSMMLIFQKILLPSLNLIKIDFESYPEIRKKFFLFIKLIVDEYFSLLFKLDLDCNKSEEFFEIIIQSVVWGIKHPDKSISKTSLKILLIMFEQVKILNIGNYFYSKFIQQLLVDLLFVIMDKLHTSNIKLQCNAFFQLVYQSKNFINIKHLKEYIEVVLNKALPDLNKKKIENITFNFINSKTLNDFESDFKKLIKITDDIWQDNSSSQ